MTPTLHQRNKAKARLNKAATPVLNQISERIQRDADERYALALFRITGKKQTKVATVATTNH